MIGPTFETNTSQFGSLSVVVVKGDIDAKTAPRLEAVLAEFSGAHVLVDLDEVDFIDSTGLRTLTRARSLLDSTGGRLVLCTGTGGSVLRTIRLAGLESDFDFVTSRQEFLEQA